MIILSLLIGMMLTVMPLPNWCVWLRPEWVFIIFVYWVMALPDRLGVGSAWLVGILLDLLTETPLGQHALAFSAITYLLSKFHSKIQNFPLWQQSFMVFVFTLLNLIIQFWVMQFTDNLPGTWQYWLSAITSAFVWPWVYLILKDWFSEKKPFVVR